MKCFIGVLMSMLGLIAPMAQAQQCANREPTGFRWPLNNWATNCNGYWSSCNRPYHLGSDSMPGNAAVGTAVYAPCTGVVRESQGHNGYGGTVILECWTGDECVSVILGHMFQNMTTINDIRYPGLQVQVGQSVVKGQLVGYIADRNNNGGWSSHVHVGIRKGAYVNANACDGGWNFAGYSNNQCVRNTWYDPDVFIPAHVNPVQAAPPPPPQPAPQPAPPTQPPAQPARPPFTYNSANNPYTCDNAATPGANWWYSCNARTIFNQGSSVYGLMRIDNVFVRHQYKVKTYKNNVFQWEWAGPWYEGMDPQWGWQYSFFSPLLANASVGRWKFEYYVNTGAGFPNTPVGSSQFDVVDIVRPPYTYNGNKATCLGPVTGGANTNWWYTCTNPRDSYTAGQTVYGMVAIHSVWVDHRYRIAVYKDGIHQWTYDTNQNDVDEQWGWQYSQTWPRVENAARGNWEFRISLVTSAGVQPLTNIPFRVN